MYRENKNPLARLLAGVSVIAVAGFGASAYAQDVEQIPEEQQDEARVEDEVVVLGIRGSLAPKWV